MARSVCIDGLVSKANTGWQRVMIYRLWDGMVWGKTREGGGGGRGTEPLLATAGGRDAGVDCFAWASVHVRPEDLDDEGE